MDESGHALPNAPSSQKLQRRRRAQRDARTNGKQGSAGAAALVGSQETYGSGKRCELLLMSAVPFCMQDHARHPWSLRAHDERATA